MTYSAKSDISGTISQFTRRKSIIINSGSIISAYQVKLTISYESAMQTDFRDIRFNDTSGNYCSYWIESKTDSNTATVWIKTDLVTGNNTVYMYYGNSGILTSSSGTNTFDFFDDFNDTSLDTSKWDDAAGNSTSITSGVLSIINSRNIYSKSSFDMSSKIIRARSRASNYTLYTALVGFTTNNPYVSGAYMSYPTLDASNTYLRNVKTGINETNYTVPNVSRNNNFYVHEIFKQGSTNYLTMTDSSGVSGSVSGSGSYSTTTTTNYISMGGYTSSYVDWVLVRKYASSEPTTCVGGEEVSTVSWLSGWNRRKLITITGSTSSQTDFQMKLTVHKSTGTDTSTDIYLGTNVNNDFSDIRFTYNDGITNISYWIESYTSGSIATIWIKIPSIPISPCTVTIYLYYGNSSATSSASGDNTFLLFDDFTGSNGSSPDTTTKWTLTQTGGAITDIQNNMLRSYTPTGGNSHATSKITFTLPVIIEFNAQWPGWGNDDAMAGISGCNIWYGLSGHLRIGNYVCCTGDASGWAGWTGYLTNTLYKFRWTITSTSLKTEELVNGNSDIHAGSYVNTTINFGDNSPHTTHTTYIDIVIVRKYASPEPTFSSIGIEETFACGTPSANLIVLEILSEQLSRPYPYYIDIDILSKMLDNFK